MLTARVVVVLTVVCVGISGDDSNVVSIALFVESLILPTVVSLVESLVVSVIESLVKSVV